MAEAWALQRAVWAALDAALACPVYDGTPPVGAAYPYVTIGATDAAVGKLLSGSYRETRRTISVWSADPSDREVLDILDSIRTTLHRARLTLASGRLLTLSVERTRHALDADGQSYMGQATVMALLH